MNLVEGFAPIATPDSQGLILGTAPSCASLKQQQYYAHPRNAFWPILGSILGFDPQLNYPQRKTFLRQKRLALWDVLLSCERKMSADSSIQPIQFNNFNQFFKTHPHLQAVFFNGQMAKKLFFKQPKIPKILVYSVLPSTSPANARLRFSEKLQAWQVIQDFLKLQKPPKKL